MTPLALAAILLASPSAVLAATIAPLSAPAAPAVSSAPVASAPAEGRPITLDEAYAAALKRSETVAQKGETYAQVMAQIQQLWSEIQPRINLNAQEELQDTPGPNVNFPLPANNPTVAINGHQPLFTGLRDFLAIKAGKAQGESAELAIQRAKQLLYQDVTSAYLNLLQSRRDIRTHEEQVSLTADRVKELKNFEDIGRSRKSEVLAAESQQAQDVADLETARGAELVQQATLRFLTGIEEDLAPQEISVPVAAGDMQPFLTRSQSRPDVEAARKDVEYADLYVSINRRQYWPTIAVDGNYYLKRPRNYSQYVNWDATFSGSLPLYWGGQIRAQTRQAEAQRGFNEQALSLALRSAELDVRSAYSGLSSDLSIVAALEKAMTLAEANAKAQTADYRHGLVTNIDVLASLATVQNTRLRLDAAQIQAFYSRVKLEVAAGGPETAR